MELVLERRVDVRSDLLVESLGALAAEQQVVPAQRRAAHAELLTADRHPLAVLLAQPGDADRRLAVTPALVAPTEGAVVAVPRSERPLVELIEHLGADGLATVDGVDHVAQGRKLPHRDGVEPDPVAGAPDGVGERREHGPLPLAVLALALAVADAEMDVVPRGVAQRAVAEQAAHDQLELVVAERVLLRRDQDLVALLDLPRLPLALRCEDQVVGRAGEAPPTRAPPRLHLELPELVGLTVVVPLDDATRRYLAGDRIHGHDLDRRPLVDDLADLLAAAVREH